MTSNSMKTSYLFDATDKVVVITGGGSGIGADMALALDLNGAAAVYILGRRLEPLEKTASKATNGSIKPIVADITDKTSLFNAKSIIEHTSTYVDVVIANSGVTGPDGGVSKLLANGNTPPLSELQKALESIDPADFTATFNTNVTGAWLTATTFLSLLDAANKFRGPTEPRAQIIVTTSISAFNRSPYVGMAYAASKAASVHLVKQLATTLAPYKIRCNAIAPGFFPSEMTEGRWGDGDVRQEGAIPATLVPLQRTGSEEDIAGLVLYLVGRAGAYVNGCVHLVDGGRVAIGQSTY